MTLGSGLAKNALIEGSRLDRRGFLRGFAAIGALASVGLSSCSLDQPETRLATLPLPTPVPRLRAAFSHNGLTSLWNSRGRDTARFIGQLLGIDVVSYDTEFSIDKQRQGLADIAQQDWDFVVVHPIAINAYNDEIRQITKRGIPVISMDTRLADDLDQIGVTTFLEPDNIWMGEQATQAIIDAVHSDDFEIVQTWGQTTHTGAQGRARGFRNVIARYPKIKVVDETPADWDLNRARQIWQGLLARHPNIRGGFFHSDEMALGALTAIQSANKGQHIAVAAVDGMQPACEAVARGDIVAVSVNPSGRIHASAMWVGYFLATKGERANVPKFIRIDGGIVTKDNAAGYIWQGDNLLI